MVPESFSYSAEGTNTTLPAEHPEKRACVDLTEKRAARYWLARRVGTPGCDKPADWVEGVAYKEPAVK